MIAPYLEIAVLVLGMTILMCETFAANIDKKIFAYAGIVGLVAVLIASFFLTDSPTQHAGPFWNFYSADALSIFAPVCEFPLPCSSRDCFGLGFSRKRSCRWSSRHSGLISRP